MANDRDDYDDDVDRGRTLRRRTRQYLVTTPRGNTLCLDAREHHDRPFLTEVFQRACRLDGGGDVSSSSVFPDDAAVRRTAFLQRGGREFDPDEDYDLDDGEDDDAVVVSLSLRLRVRGGMADRQNRVGSKFGGGGVASTQTAERDRKERLRKLALESVDLAKDPYLMRNHLGTYECRLCLTLHTNEGNYLAHTQGRKHQAGLARRAAAERAAAARGGDGVPARRPAASTTTRATTPSLRVGRPGYRVSKSRCPDTNRRCLSFELDYPRSEDDAQPRHRFMSAYEQKVDLPPDRDFQYLLVACRPYETVAFKVPNHPIDKSEGRFVTNWDATEKRFNLTFHFLDPAPAVATAAPTEAPVVSN